MRTRKRLPRNLLADLGALDLASIIIGGIVTTLIATTSVIGVFVTVPWSQDYGAKGHLQAVMTAESAAHFHDKVYKSIPTLATEKYLVDTDSVGVILATDTPNSCYVAASLSSTGSVFIASSQSSDIGTYDLAGKKPSFDTSWCVKDTDLYNMVDGLVHPGSAQPTSTPTPPPPPPDWRTLVVPGNATTTINDVAVRVSSTNAFCLDVTVGTTSPTRTAWLVYIDTNRPPFYGRTSSLWTSSSIVHNSTWSIISGSGQTSNPWNNSWNPGLMASPNTYLFSVCESSMIAPPDEPVAYTSKVTPSTTQWSGRTYCMVDTITGTGVYPFYAGWATNIDLTPAINALKSTGYHPEQISWSPNGSVGQTVTPSSYTDGVSVYVATDGRDNAVMGTGTTVFTICLYDD